uniref:Uncharacterized protein n=1 Tax=Physcomitrium patens TaxID=3218 RepID=A0A2K1IJP2_PHYPA|nr:hypothetical protein PHYPA_028185 [Physcomitrium patens]
MPTMFHSRGTAPRFVLLLVGTGGNVSSLGGSELPDLPRASDGNLLSNGRIKKHKVLCRLSSSFYFLGMHALETLLSFSFSFFFSLLL